MSLLSFQAARDKQTELLRQQEAMESLADALLLEAAHFVRDENGCLSTLTPDGFAHYAPRFRSAGVTLSGHESFRDLQQIKSGLFEAHDDTTRMGLLKLFKRSYLSEEESRLAFAFLNDDIAHLPKPQ